MVSEQVLSTDEVAGRLERLPFTRVHLRVAGILGAGTFFDAYTALVLASVAAVMFKRLNISLGDLGMLVALGYGGQFAGAALIGWLSDRYGRRNAFVWSVAIFGLFSIGTAVAWNLSSIVVFRVLQGFGLGAEIPVGAALFTEFISSRRRGFVFLMYQNFFGWGELCAPLLAAACLTLFGHAAGWRVALGIGALPVLLAVVAWRALPESPRWLMEHGRAGEAQTILGKLTDAARRTSGYPDAFPEAEIERRGAVPGAPKPGAEAGARARELFSPPYWRRTVLVWVMFGTSFFVVYAYLTWLPTLYESIGHLGVNTSLVLTSAIGATSVIVGYVFAAVAERLGRRKVFIASFAITAVGAAIGVVAGAAGASTWPVLFVTTIVMTVGTFPINIGAFMYAGELFPTRMRGWAIGSGSAIQRASIAIGPYVVGLLVTGKGAQAHGLTRMFVLLLIVAAVGLIVVVIFGVETAGRTLEALAAEQEDGAAPTATFQGLGEAATASGLRDDV